jgi:hypothetical protein
VNRGVGGGSFLRQVALWGRVEDGNGEPMADAQVTITKMPEAFSVRLRAFGDRYGRGWESAKTRPDRT